MDIKPGSLVIIKIQGETHLVKVVGFLPCGDVVVSALEGKKTIAVPPKDIEEA